ncbi:Myosin regulatory light chain 2, atrial isoform [Apodemus speciosus]|uniref:Myosin regulatory light chain 2, atrial isoform n=1 Tax=Apodemus speciosus TaxID=105296 RepID=A0ABQ0F934_APOSI
MSSQCSNKLRFRNSRKAFSCIDQNRDGIICKSDLKETYSQLASVQSGVPLPGLPPSWSWPLPLPSPPGKPGRAAWVTSSPTHTGRVSVPEEELDAMLQEGKGPINFTVFLTLFGEKLNGPCLPVANVEDVEERPGLTWIQKIIHFRIPAVASHPGTDPEEAILSAFRMFDPSGQGVVNKEEFKQLLMTQADKFSPAEVEQLFALSPMDPAGNIDYKSLCYIITHGDEKEE